MQLNLLDIISVAGAVIATGGVLAALLVSMRSKLPQETIKVQNEAIAALERQNRALKDSVVELTAILTKLQTRVELLETLPLQNIDKSLTALLVSVENLASLGHSNAELIRDRNISTMPSTVINNR